jgi:hypothetical protein
MTYEAAVPAKGGKMFARPNVYLLMLVALATISAPESAFAKRDRGQAMVVGFVVPEYKDKPLKK